MSYSTLHNSTIQDLLHIAAANQALLQAHAIAAMARCIFALAGVTSALVAPPTTSSTRPKTSLHAQTAEFAQPLWGRDNFDDVDESSDTVKCTVYNIGGELTQVLSLTCSKQLPMIPHVGVRLYGTEYFYSDVIESRPVAVMQDMLEDFPQVSFDLGPATVTEAELEEWIASDAL